MGDADGRSRWTLGRVALWTENRLFPLLFLAFALENAFWAYRIGCAFAAPPGDLTVGHLASKLVSHLVLCVFDGIVAYALLMRGEPDEPPQGPVEVFLPLVGAFFYSLINAFPSLPSEYNPLLLPQGAVPLVVAGTVLNLVGLTWSLIAVVNLRKSFGVFVQVRAIVSHGLYRYVRHPIYSGYLLSFTGLFLLTPRLQHLALCALLAAVTIARAVVEERKMVEHVPAYREYRATTPFLVPFLWGRRRGQASD